MAYLLRFDANNDNYVSNPSVMLNGHFRIDVDMEIRSFPTIQKLFDGDGNPSNQRLDITLRKTGADLRNYCHFLADDQPVGSLSSFLNQRFIFSLVRDGTDSDQSLKEFSFIGCRFNQQAGQFLDADIYSIKVYDSGGVLIHDFSKEVLSGGNDTLFPDAIGGNDGTLINFPADNSQWVVYDDGSGGVLDISPSSIISEGVFGIPSVSPLGVILLPPSIGTEEAIGMPSVSSAGVDIQPVSVSSSEVLGELQVIPLGVNLSPNPITSQEVVQGPVVAVGLTVLNPDGVESGEFVPEPLLDLMLKQVLVPSVPDTFSVGRPVVVGGDRIVIPIVARTNFTKIQEYLKTLGFSGALEDVILAWLRSEGYEGQWNDAWYEYLEAEGLEGSLTDKRSKWRNE